jgi:UDP:flavonoid glycosyltransferase YjiC (YdhE family)
MKAFDAVFKRGVLPILEETYNRVVERNEPGRTVVVASVLALGARVAQEKHGIPTASAHLSPCILRTVYDPPRMMGMFLPPWLPKWLQRLQWAGVDGVIDLKLCPPINEFRAKFGLPPVGKIFRDWLHSPQRVIGLWPDWFGPPQRDWPPNATTVGFPLYDEAGIAPMTDELSNWLDAGDPPIVFTPGSAMIFGHEFFEAAVGACAKLNRRGILLTRHAEQIPRELPKGVRHVDFAPFGQLLPRCAALVHHGGIGTTSQALCAGVPQLVMPMAHDQLDNSARVQRLTGGREISPRRFKADNVARILGKMLNSPQTLEKCREIAARFEGVNAIAAACDLVEGLAPQTPANTVLSAS